MFFLQVCCSMVRRTRPWTRPHSRARAPCPGCARRPGLLCLCRQPHDTHCALHGLRSSWSRAGASSQDGLELHEEEEGKCIIDSVGVVLAKHDAKLRHRNDRAWRLYRATRELWLMPRVSGEVLRVWLGHVVHYCESMRLDLSILRSSYRFVESPLGSSKPLPNSAWQEMIISCGFIFLAEIDLAAACLDHLYCADASLSATV